MLLQKSCFIIRWNVERVLNTLNRESQLCILSRKGEIMEKEIIVAIVSMIGTVVGSFGGIVTSTKLTSYRLEKLEQKVDKHNSFAERMPVLEEQIKVINHRIDDLENFEREHN